MSGNEGLITFLQQAVGYSLTGDTREQSLFFLYGRGANGKSTFIEAITGLLGPYSKHTRPETFMAKKSDGVPNDLAELESVRMVAAVELEEGRKLAEVLTKQVSGGDKLKARYLFQEFFEYHPQFKLWLCGNHKPRIHGTDHAIWRRIKLIPWTVTIPDHQQDKSLPDRLKHEWPGILTWAVKGCLEWQSNGLSTPKEVQAATANYRKEMDVLGDFFENCVISGDNESVTVKDLYEAYTTFCNDNGENKERLGKKKFNERVTDRDFDQYRAGKNILTWRGLGMRED
jgi:putative DNA primase/helicase